MSKATSGDSIREMLKGLREANDKQYYEVWGWLHVRSAYLAGPMRGYPDYNYPMFNAVAKYLRILGYKIENPAETDAEVAERAAKADNPLDVYMERDLADVARTDALFLLPGWRASEGAMIEFTVAQLLVHPCFELPSFDEIKERTVTDPDVPDVPVLPAVLPTGSEERKNIPLTTGLLDYFPAALAAVASVSKAGNDKHNPGEPLHWARGKSMDQADCIARHLVERGGIDPETGMRHSAQLAWRALALLQIELEEAGEAPLARGARS